MCRRLLCVIKSQNQYLYALGCAIVAIWVVVTWVCLSNGVAKIPTEETAHDDEADEHKYDESEGENDSDLFAAHSLTPVQGPSFSPVLASCLFRST